MPSTSSTASAPLTPIGFSSEGTCTSGPGRSAQAAADRASDATAAMPTTRQRRPGHRPLGNSPSSSGNPASPTAQIHARIQAASSGRGSEPGRV